MFDWNDLKHFLAVARAGSALGGAAMKNLSQTTAARRLAALERDIGLTLFENAQSGYRLSPAGKELLSQAEKVEKEVLAFKALVQERAKRIAGTVRVSTNETFANLLLMPALPEFNRLYPDIRIDVFVEDRMVDLVSGEADVALRGGLNAGTGDLVARRLHDLPWSVYCSRAYAERHGGVPGLANLSEHAVIGGAGGVAAMPGPRWLEEKSDGRIAARSNSLTSLLSATKAGLGLGALPCILADREPDLLVCFHLPASFTASLWLVTRSELRNNPCVKTFNDYIAGQAQALRHLFEPRAPGG